MIAVGHTFLLAAYTMPEHVVPLRFRFWSQAYARVLFHQDWRLFAPDPPACGCFIAILDEPEADPVWLHELHGGFIWERMAANACRYAESSIDEVRGQVIAGDALGTSLRTMTGRDPRTDGSRIEVRRSFSNGRNGSWEVRFAETPLK